MTAARGAGVRVSLHFYNNLADLDRLLAGLGKVLKPRRAGMGAPCGKK
jgi:selenocysteine lyase/cysteine desulfurase